MNSDKACRRCETEISSQNTGGLCPHCLMARNFDSQTMPTGENSSPVPPLSPEELAQFFPHFEILECLGRGGMGAVYKARQKALDRIVALKVLAGEWQGDPHFAERFEQEAKILAQLSHANIVTIHDFGEAGGLYYIVMEYVDGVNLRDLLRDGKMKPEQALAIVPPVCEALEYAHEKGIVHRDVKPENLLFDQEGRVKIADFGIASLMGVSGEDAGTPLYMAPEQERERVDRRTDVYALGVVFYEMLTGERPAKDLVSPSQKVEVDVRIDEMVLRALAKEPQRRYQTAEEFGTVVKTVIATRVDEQKITEKEKENFYSKESQLYKITAAFAFFFGVISGLIPMLFYWLRPWAAPWLTDRALNVLLEVSGVAAVLAILLGFFAKKRLWGLYGFVVGAISLAIWLSFFFAGKLSQSVREERKLGQNNFFMYSKLP